MKTVISQYLFSADGAHHGDPGAHKFDPNHHVMDSPEWHLNGPWGEVHVPLRLFEGTPFETSLTVLFLCITTVIVIGCVMKVAKNRSANPHQPPKGLSNAVESIVVFVRDEIVYPNCGETNGRRLLPFFLSLFFFILVGNYIGLLPWSFTATSQFSVTFTLAIIIWVIMFFGGFVAHGPKFAVTVVPLKLEKNFMLPLMAPIWLLLFILELLVGPIIKAFALMVRLKANMTAGHLIILGLLFLPFKNESYGWGVLGIGLSLIIMLLEFLVCLLQAYVFTLLSAIFIGHSVNTEEHH